MDCQRLLALAELADQAGQTSRSGEALLWSRDAAVYAVFCLTSSGFDQNGHGHRLRLHAMCITARWRDAFGWREPERQQAGVIGLHSWPRRESCRPRRFPNGRRSGSTASQPADEFTIHGPRPVVHHDGLGVPLIAGRCLQDDELTMWKPYGPRQAVFAATAVIRPRGPIAGWRDQPVELVLHDPLREQALNLGAQALPLAYNLTAPLVGRLAQSPIRKYEYLGVFDPEFYA